MNTHADKKQESKIQSTTNEVAQKKGNGGPAFQFIDNRREAIAQRKLQEMANNSTQVNRAAQLQAIADNHSAKQKQYVQKKENNTGLPDQLKAGIENISGYSMDDVKVHYNSDKPAQLNAHAYAQGADIHLASGQEKHLPHEAWHVVQQKQGRVKPTLQMKGKININDDQDLESEADTMGAKALQMKVFHEDEKSLNAYQDLNALPQSQSVVGSRVQRKEFGVANAILGVESRNSRDGVMQLIGSKRINTLIGIYKNSKDKFMPYLKNLDFSELIDLLTGNYDSAELKVAVKDPDIINEIKSVLNVRLVNRHGVTEKSIEDYRRVQSDFSLPDLPEEFAPKERLASVQMDDNGFVAEHSIPRDISILHAQEREIQQAYGISASGAKQFEVAIRGSAGTKLNHILPANRIIKHMVNSWNMAHSNEWRVTLFGRIIKGLGISIAAPRVNEHGYDMKELKTYMITVVQHVAENGLNVFSYPYTLGDNGGSDIDGITGVEKVKESNSSALAEVEAGWKFESGKLDDLAEGEKLAHFLRAQKILNTRYQVFLNIVFE